MSDPEEVLAAAEGMGSLGSAVLRGVDSADPIHFFRGAEKLGVLLVPGVLHLS